MNAPATARVKEGGLFRRLRAWREQHVYSLVSSLGRCLQRPIATLLTVGVMAVAIALPLGLALALANVERLSGSVRESREVSAFLKLDINAGQAQQLAEELGQRPDVAIVTLKTPAQGLEEFRRMSELAGALELLDGNPLPTVLVLQPRDDGAALAQSLRQRPEVALVQHDAVWRQRLTAWLDLGQRLLWVVGSLLGLGVLLVVGNTIRLEFGARRDEIEVMQQLGATDGFIRRPFIYLGLWYGLAAGALATALLFGAVAALQPALTALTRSYGSAFRLDGADLRGALAILAAGALLGWAGAWLASGHHLRQTRPTDL
jgi:cell division transport system permease protein